MFHIGVQAKIIFDSCMFDGGDLEVIMKSNICDVPRGFSNHAEADGLECLYGSSVRWFSGTPESDSV